MSKVFQRSRAPKNRTTVRSHARPTWVIDGMRVGFKVLGKTAPALASVLAERLFRSPRRHQRPAWEEEILAGSEAFRLPFAGGTLPAWSWGSGPTVLLVHGWEGRGSQLGALVDPLVEAGFRVIAFDAPGHGDGHGAQGTVVEIARTVTAALSELGPVHAIVAHSVGCTATAHALSRAGTLAAWTAAGRLPRLVFIAPPTSALKFTRFFAAQLGLGEEVRRRMVARLESRYGVPMEDLDTTRLAVDAPLLVIHDRDDLEVPFEAGAAVADAWKGARLMETHGLGHRRVLRAPHVVDEAVRFAAEGAWDPRTGLPRFGLERELFDRSLRQAA